VNFVADDALLAMDLYHSFCKRWKWTSFFFFLVFWSVRDISAHPTKGWVSFVHCAGIQGSSSARRKCREEGFKGQQKFILQANKNRGRNRIDTLETVDDVVLLGNIFLHPGAPHRRKSDVCHVIPTIGTHPISLSIHSLGFKQLCVFFFFLVASPNVE
jgi:hypothetical protein